MGDPHPARARHLAGQKAGDEEARQHEEHVNADESSSEERQSSMKRKDEPDGDRTHSLDVETQYPSLIGLGHR